MSIWHDLAARGLQIFGQHMLKVPARLHFSGQDLPDPTDVLIPTSAGEIRAAVYRSLGNRSSQPVYVNIHGGGYVWRHPEQDDHICRHLASEADCVVVNLDYSTGPQKRFPTAPTQVYEACRWVSVEGQNQGWDGKRMAIGGQSAGGGLAVGVSLKARDSGDFKPLLQIIDYAVLDQFSDPATKRSRTAQPLITPLLSRIFTAAYIPNPLDRRDVLASPILAPSLSNLPPSLVITADFDSLRDEGDTFASALASAGVPVVHKVIPDVDHFFTHNGPTAAAHDALNVMAEQLRSAFSSKVSPSA